MQELLARLRVLARRKQKIISQSNCVFGDIVLNPHTLFLYCGSEAFKLPDDGTADGAEDRMGEAEQLPIDFSGKVREFAIPAGAADCERIHRLGGTPDGNVR